MAARQEAYQMQHFFVGAEHLLIASLSIRGSLAGNIVQEFGLTPEYVIDAIRRKVGKGSKARLWAGVPNTPRTDLILNIADTIAGEAGHEEIDERDLLIALFEEKDSVPLRVLDALGLTDVDKLADLARSFTLIVETQQPYIQVEYGEEYNPQYQLSKDHLYLIRRMFYGYKKLRIERQLTGGYSDANVLVITPIHADSREDVPLVAKINKVDDALDEVQRYEAHVKNRLPAMTARIEEKPTVPEMSKLAGIKYTLVTGYDRVPRDLRAVMNEWTPKEIGDWIKQELFPTFGRMWWTQTRPYRFQVWREYDWLLPPILTLEYSPKTPLDNAYRLRMPLKRAQFRRLDYGDFVTVENFVVQKVYPERNTIQLAVAHGIDSARAYKIEVRGVDFTNAAYYRGEVIEKITGTVWQTRAQHLMNAVRMLEPDFDAQAEKIQVNEDIKLINPIWAYEGFLDSFVNGSLGTIHGDLHPGNMMLGPKNSAFLIDFAHTRDGHTIFDWANLEVSLLVDYVVRYAGTSWDDMRRAIQQIALVNGGETFEHDPTQLRQALHLIAKVRQITAMCLANPDHWAEYYYALTFCALRAMTWETVSLEGRRLSFLVAGLAINELRTRHRPTSGTDTPSPDDTEVTLRSE